MRLFGSLAAITLLLILSGCNGTPPKNETVAVPPPTPAMSPDHCLADIWGGESDSDKSFDVRNDRLGQGSFSCDGFTSASALQRSINALRVAVETGNDEQMASLVHFPFLFFDERGRRTIIRSHQELRARFSDIFTPEVRAAIVAMSLREMTAIRSQGIFADAGGIWLRAERPGDAPTLVALNRQAIAAASRSRENARP